MIGTALGPAFPDLGWVPAPRYLLRRARILELTRDFVPGRLLEVGSGAGTLLVEYARRGFDCEALEMSEEARALATRIVAAAGVKAPIHAASQTNWQNKFDYLFSFDVLEHIDKDTAALADWMSWLRPGGTFVLSVPARMKRWSVADEWAGHYRRYEWHQLIELLTATGFEIEVFECYGFPATNFSERFNAGLSRKSVHRDAASSEESRKANNDRSGIDRRLHLKLYPLLDSPPGRAALSLCDTLQKRFLKRDWGTGYIVRARKRA